MRRGKRNKNFFNSEGLFCKGNGNLIMWVNVDRCGVIFNYFYMIS